MATSVKFFGLCGIGIINGIYQAEMPTIMEHRAVAVIPVKQIKPDPAVTTKPDFIFHDPTGVQYAGWNLSTMTLLLDGATGQATWDQAERDKVIDLNKFHARAPIHGASNPAAVVKLTEGLITAGTDTQIYDIIQNGKVIEPVRKVHVSIVWTATKNFDTLVDTAGKLKIGLQKNAGVTITNVAPVKNGDGHFIHYYKEFFKNQPRPEELISIKNRNIEVYDCVPPAALPLP
jgi:hypothetical protein